MIGTLSSAAKSMNGVLHGSDRSFHGVSTDTRTLCDGELFFALQGPNFDGRDYLAKANSRGAAGAVVGGVADGDLMKADLAEIAVDDAKLALGQLGAAWRESQSVRVVGITGSNGKTTLKEMIAACLATRAPTLATAGNLNNDIGMPLMLTRIEDEHEFAVIEMGANHAGEIAYLAALANPDVVVITNAGAAHLEGFGSVEGVAHAKGELFEIEDRPSVAVLNADDDYFPYWATLVEDVKTLSFGFSTSADVRADNIDSGVSGSTFRLHLPTGAMNIALPLPGIHNIRNACAAAAVATALDIENQQIKQALETLAPVSGRIQPLDGINGCKLFDDSYNANPLSVVAAAEFLAALSGESWLVLGDMKELGEDAMELHREVGASARASGIDRLFALGDLCKHAVEGFGSHASWYGDIDNLIADLSRANSGTNVLVKGSRSMHMERVVDVMRESPALRREA